VGLGPTLGVALLFATLTRIEPSPRSGQGNAFVGKLLSGLVEGDPLRLELREQGIDRLLVVVDQRPRPLQNRLGHAQSLRHRECTAAPGQPRDQLEGGCEVFEIEAHGRVDELGRCVRRLALLVGRGGEQLEALIVRSRDQRRSVLDQPRQDRFGERRPLLRVGSHRNLVEQHQRAGPVDVRAAQRL